MPSIQPTASPWGLDWNTLPIELKLVVSDRVRPDIRAQLTGVSEPWRNAALSAAFERRARAFLAKRENVSPDDLPAPIGGMAAGDPLRRHGLPHAAMVADLHAICARLPAVDTGRAVYSTFPDLKLGPGSVFLPRRGEPAFVAYGRDTGSLVVFSNDGTWRPLLALAGRNLPLSPRPSVIGSLLSPSALDDTTLVIVEHGALGVFDSTSDEVRPVPQGLRQRHPAFAANCRSRSGRYIATSDGRENSMHLRVYDQSTDRLVTDTVMPRSDYRQPIALDDDGTLLLLGPDRFELGPGQQASEVKATPFDDGFVTFGLSPDNRQFLLQNPETGVIALEDRHDGHRTTLQPPVDQGGRTANTIAFSPAMAMAAVLYSTGGLAIFDLLNATADAHTLQPRLHMPLEHGPLYTGNAAAWFDRDAGGVHVAHPLSTPRSPLPPGTGLVHLRFD